MPFIFTPGTNPHFLRSELRVTYIKFNFTLSTLFEIKETLKRALHLNFCSLQLRCLMATAGPYSRFERPLLNPNNTVFFLKKRKFILLSKDLSEITLDILTMKALVLKYVSNVNLSLSKYEYRHKQTHTNRCKHAQTSNIRMYGNPCQSISQRSRLEVCPERMLTEINASKRQNYSMTRGRKHFFASAKFSRFSSTPPESAL